MFYLGSIAGILPYILAFCLTLVWGGHAGIPFFTSGSTPESVNEIIVKESKPCVEKLASLDFENKIITEKTTKLIIPFNTRTELLNLYVFRYFNSTVLGISLLRAPPVSLF